MDWGWLLFSFEGRINRAKYWLTVLLFFAVAVVAMIILFALGFALVGWLIAAVVYLAMIYVGLAVGAKRLHDRDKSAWWLLLFYGLPSVLSGAGNAIGGSLSMILSFVSFVISIWALVELGFLRGTEGPNQYGPDPLANAVRG